MNVPLSVSVGAGSVGTISLCQGQGVGGGSPGDVGTVTSTSLFALAGDFTHSTRLGEVELGVGRGFYC